MITDMGVIPNKVADESINKRQWWPIRSFIISKRTSQGSKKGWHRPEFACRSSWDMHGTVRLSSALLYSMYKKPCRQSIFSRVKMEKKKCRQRQHDYHSKKLDSKFRQCRVHLLRSYNQTCEKALLQTITRQQKKKKKKVYLMPVEQRCCKRQAVTNLIRILLLYIYNHGLDTNANPSFTIKPLTINKVVIKIHI